MLNVVAEGSLREGLRNRTQDLARALRRFWIEALVIALGVALAGATLASTSPTADEEKHIRNGFAFESRGRALQDETPSARLHTVLLGDEPDEMWDGDGAWRRLALSRVATAFAFGILLVLVALWARALFSPLAARVVLALAATSPTLLAHASVATADMFLTTCAFGACYALFRYRRSPTTSRAIAIGVWVGLALLAKISGIFLYATILLAWLAIRDRRVIYVLVVPLVVLNLGYGFRRTLQPLDAIPLTSSALTSLEHSSLRAVPLPVPAGFIRAIDYSLADRVRRLDQAQLPAYMLGEQYVGKRASYFPFAFLVKTSGIILALFALGLVAARKQRVALTLGLFPLVFFATNVFLNPFDIGVRYILPVYPFVIVCCGFAIQRLRPRTAIAAATIQAAFTLAAFPNYLASFNAISWLVPKHHLLSDSNLDWGQMNHLVTEDLAAHPTDEPVHICTIGAVIGQRPEDACTTAVRRGRYYVSATTARLGQLNFLPYFRHLPIRNLGDVISVYEVTSETDFDMTFVDDWEVSTNGTWKPVRTRFGLLELGNATGCVDVRSAHAVTGHILLGADDTLTVYDGDTIIARDTKRSGVDWPDTSLTLAKPTQIRMQVCNASGISAVQAAVR